MARLRLGRSRHEILNNPEPRRIYSSWWCVVLEKLYKTLHRFYGGLSRQAEDRQQARARDGGGRSREAREVRHERVWEDVEKQLEEESSAETPPVKKSERTQP